MEQGVAQLWSMGSAYFAAPLNLFSNGFQAHALVPIVGLVSLIAGVVLAIRTREKQAVWTVLPALAGLLAPFALDVAFNVLGWVGLGFAVIFGFFAVTLWIHIIASDATKRLPVWLIGIFILSFVAYCDFLAILAVWGA